jgi:hypothetical protein
MDFLKKHYEKVLLGVVLCGLVVGAIFLTLMVPQERQKLDDLTKTITKKPPKPIPPLDLSTNELALQRLQTAFMLDLATTNKLVNPMLWRKRSPDNVPIKDTPRNIGPEAVVVITNRPLFLTITFDSVSTAGAAPRYLIGVKREAAIKPDQRDKKQKDAQLNVKNDVFVLREVKGPPESPTELVLEMNDSGEMVKLNRDRVDKDGKPVFQRVDGYTADLKYPPDNRPPWINQRLGAVLRNIEGEDYNVVAINKNEVILSAKLNGKKTIIPYNAGS